MITTTEKKKQGAISVKPYFDPSVSNMGLEKYGLSLWDGVYHEEQLACIGEGPNRRYVTGLNEWAPEVKNLPDDLKEAKIKDIRRTVALLEKEIGFNQIPKKITDDWTNEEFWGKVKTLHPDNHAFWEKISLSCGNDQLTLDPNDPNQLVKIYAIDAGGFSLVARSYEDARSRAVPPKFYLDRYEETASTVTEVTKIKNRAISELQTLSDSNLVKLLYIAKVVDGNSTQYKKSTPNDIIYGNMDKFINGDGIEKSKKRAAQTFLDASRQDMETLKLRAVIKDATFYKFIALKPDGFIYHMKSGEMIGRTAHDAVEFLKNPLHDQILTALLKEVEQLWNA